MQLVVVLGLFIILVGCAEDSSQFKGAPTVACQDQTLESQFIAHWHNGGPTLVHEKDIQGFIQKNRNELNFVEPNYAVRIEPRERSDETKVNFTLGVSDILKNIGVYPAWNNGYLGQDVLVAVIDSGVDINHPHLRSSIYTNYDEIPDNGIDDDQNGFVDDVHGWNFADNSNQVRDEIGHGTSVAGIISGRSGSNDSLAIAPRSQILPVDIISGYTGNEFDAKRGVDYALQMKAKVINNSWSIACSRYLARASQEYERRNVIFVNSAGNIRQDVIASRVMLASLTLSNFLNVGSTNLFGDISNFSGFGKSINIWAPGEQIPVLAHSTLPNVSAEASGTSISAAVVSGAAAILWSSSPNSSAQRIISKLVKNSYKRDGHSIVSIDRALGLWTEPVFTDPVNPDTPVDPNSPNPTPGPMIEPSQPANGGSNSSPGGVNANPTNGTPSSPILPNPFIP